MINAAGHMETMDIGIECLLAANLQTAYPLAQQLNQLNTERRQVESQMKQEALSELTQLELDQSIYQLCSFCLSHIEHRGRDWDCWPVA